MPPSIILRSYILDYFSCEGEVWKKGLIYAYVKVLVPGSAFEKGGAGVSADMVCSASGCRRVQRRLSSGSHNGNASDLVPNLRS